MLRNAFRALAALALLATALGAHATFHLWRITQVYSNADGSVQYIELMAYASGQQFVHGHTIVSSQGATSHSFTIPTDLPGDTAITSPGGGGYYGGGGATSFKSMVIGTQGFAALGVVTPDFVVPNNFLFTSGGTLRWGEGADSWDYPALPMDGTLALNRTGSTSANAPMNFNGDTGRIALAATANVPGALSGLWWNASESGWGVDFTQRRNIIFAALYTYDGSGNPKWYVASACTMGSAGATSGTCSGTLYDISGPSFFGSTFEASAVKPVPAGSIAVTFQDANTASMTYSVGTQSRTVPIARQPISAGSIPGVDYTDLWWNPNESGWGLAIAQQGSVMFLAWYVYDTNGKPVWYIASSCGVSGAGCTGPLYQTSGPPFGATFDPTRVKVTPAGTVSLTFSDPNTGVLSYTVGGVTATKSITRQMF